MGGGPSVNGPGGLRWRRLAGVLLGVGLFGSVAGCGPSAAPNPATQRIQTLLTAFFAGHFREAQALLVGPYGVPWQEDYTLFRYYAHETHTPWTAVRWTITCPATRVTRSHNWPTGPVAACTVRFNEPWINPLTLHFFNPLRPSPAATFAAYDWDAWMYSNGGPVPGALFTEDGPLNVP